MFDPHFRSKKKCSDFNSEHTNRLEDYVSGQLVYSDRLFDFFKNWVSGARVLPVYGFILDPSNEVGWDLLGQNEPADSSLDQWQANNDEGEY